MTVFEAKGSCEEGVNFTTHRDQHGKPTQSKESKIKNENNHIDELSDEIAHITLKEYRRAYSAADNELEEKLGELAIGSVPPRKTEDKENNVTSDDNVEERVSSGVGQELKLNVIEQNEDKIQNENEEKEKESAQENTTLDLNIIVNECSKLSIGEGKDDCKDEDENNGELNHRSPARNEHFVNTRLFPYQGASRSRHHSSGGVCLAEETTYSSVDPTSWINNLNIPIQYSLDTSCLSPPTYPFAFATSPADLVDEGISDVFSSENICEQSICDSLLEKLPREDVREAVQLLDAQGIFANIHLPPFSDVGFTECNQIPVNPTDDTCSIPVTVAEFDRTSTEYVCGSQTIDFSPQSDYSGYYSSFSPYSSKSSPSPSSSLKGSQEKINTGCSEQIYVNNWGEEYGTTSPNQASPGDTECTESNSAQTHIPILEFNKSPVYLYSPYEESLFGGVNVQKPETVVAPKAKLLAPKPTFSTRSGKERMDKKMLSFKKQRAWVSLSSKSTEVLTAADSDGDTPLMILLLEVPKENDCKLETIYALVERLSSVDNALTAVNNQGQSALYMAALFSPDEHASVITRYIAETLLRIKAPLDTVYDGGCTLLHFLCQNGAKHYKVLQELLSLHKMQNCFNLDKFNDQGMTPLHVAIKSHQGAQLDCTNTVRLLIEAGANTTLLTQNLQECSALQLAIKESCDPNLIDALLTSSSVVAECGKVQYGQETVLHLVAKRNDLPLTQQSKVYKKFVEQKAHKDARDSKGKLPLDLVATDRKEAIKKLLLQK